VIEGVEVSPDLTLLGVEVVFDPRNDPRGRSWLPFDPGLKLAYGRNGVGKSTVMMALRSALLGVSPPASFRGRVRLYASIGASIDQFLPAFLEYKAEELLQQQSDLELGDDDDTSDEDLDDDPYEVPESVEVEDEPSTSWKDTIADLECRSKSLTTNLGSLVGAIGESEWITQSFRGVSIAELHAMQREFLPPELLTSADLLAAETWWPNVPPLPVARALWLTHFLDDATAMWDGVGERPGGYALRAALRQAALEHTYCLEPAGTSSGEPAWELSPAVDRQGSDGAADELWRLTELSFREYVESCRAEGMSTGEILASGDETDVLNSMGPATALVEYDLSGPQVLGVANPCRYLRLRGWRGVARVEPHHLNWTPSVTNLGSSIDLDLWLTDMLREVNLVRIRTSDTGVEADGPELDDLDKKLECISQDLQTFDVGISGVRRTSSPRPSDWLVGQGQSLEFCDAPTGAWVAARVLSDAQRLVVGTVLRLSARSGSHLVIGDEVDVGMHVRLIRRFYEYVASRCSMGVVTTHSPVALSMKDLSRLHVRRDLVGRIEIRAWSPTTMFGEESGALGVERAHLLSALSGVLIVEGHHDRAAFEALLAATQDDRPPGSMIHIAPAMGYDGMGSSVALLLLLDVTDAPIVVVSDGRRNLDLREIRDRAAAMEAVGDSARQITAALKLQQRRSEAIAEEKALLSVLNHAIEQRMVHRIHVVALDRPDIILYARPRDFGVPTEDWEVLIAEWQSSTKAAQPFKTWLRSEKRAKLSTTQVAEAFSKLDRYEGDLGQVLAYINDSVS
jgi:hypothetical protein